MSHGAPEGCFELFEVAEKRSSLIPSTGCTQSWNRLPMRDSRVQPVNSSQAEFTQRTFQSLVAVSAAIGRESSGMESLR